MFLLWLLPALAIIVLGISYLCFRMAFFVPDKRIIGPNDYPIPEGEIYEPHREQMVGWMKEIRALPKQHFSIRSHDGLTLWATYYEYAPGAPMEIMFHGYRGNAERDLCGGVQRAFSLERNVLIVDQRASNRSDGRVISFGVNESKDCLRWVDFAVSHFGPRQKIILTGISMGATTVLMAAGNELPRQVVGVLADCGFSTAKEMIGLTIRRLGLPVKLAYPFVALGARIFGGFDIRASDAISALKRCKVPVIFFHGETDAFVPCAMSQALYDACPTRKQLVTIPGAGHGLSYVIAPERYLQALGDFFAPVLRES